MLFGDIPLFVGAVFNVLCSAIQLPIFQQPQNLCKFHDIKPNLLIPFVFVFTVQLPLNGFNCLTWWSVQQHFTWACLA